MRKRSEVHRFAVFFRPGPNWQDGVSIFDQPLDAHLAYLRNLYERGAVVAAGPLADSWGGLTILQARDKETVRELVAGDPSVIEGVLVAETHPWDPIAWDLGGTDSLLYETGPLRMERSEPPRPRESDPR
jgi:uncharacterized protein YciI